MNVRCVVITKKEKNIKFPTSFECAINAFAKLNFHHSLTQSQHSTYVFPSYFYLQLQIHLVIFLRHRRRFFDCFQNCCVTFGFEFFFSLFSFLIKICLLVEIIAWLEQKSKFQRQTFHWAPKRNFYKIILCCLLLTKCHFLNWITLFINDFFLIQFIFDIGNYDWNKQKHHSKIDSPWHQKQNLLHFRSCFFHGILYFSVFCEKSTSSKNICYCIHWLALDCYFNLFIWP